MVMVLVIDGHAHAHASLVKVGKLCDATDRPRGRSGLPRGVDAEIVRRSRLFPRERSFCSKSICHV